MFTESNLLFIFFFLEKKEAKIQAKTPNPFFITQKPTLLRLKKLEFHSVLAKPTALLLMFEIFFVKIYGITMRLI